MEKIAYDCRCGVPIIEQSHLVSRLLWMIPVDQARTGLAGNDDDGDETAKPYVPLVLIFNVIILLGVMSSAK